MSKKIIMAEGVFSKLEITLKDDVLDKLAITKENNPMKPLEADMEAIIRKFETSYMELVNKPTEAEGETE